ncbi:MAG TPA: VTT domain-containing protein [Pyrinomonadaceae bacterium]|nr:VTT domain-containing protein [Pyrinomonadaceae bacterium]
MAQPASTAAALPSESVARRERWLRTLAGLGFVLVALLLYWWSGLGRMMTPENLAELRINVWAPVLIVCAMATAWAFALPASIFLFITPLLFAPHWSALITTVGCALGSGVGYAVARFVGGAWVDRFRGGRLHRFLMRHSSFMVLFAIRLTPSSPHGFINYGAGLARLPFARFILATTLALAIKSYVYAEAVHQTVGAKSLFDALNAKTMLSLSAVAALALVGHLLHRRYLKTDPQSGAAAEDAG